MKIELSSEQEKIVGEKLKSEHFRTAEEVIAEALQTFRHKTRSTAKSPEDGEQREAVREMFSFVSANRVRLDGVTVKELIHEGRRL
jgi:hypothetical protein